MATAKLISSFFIVVVVVSALYSGGILQIGGSGSKVESFFGAFVASPFNGTLPYVNVLPQYFEAPAVLNEVSSGFYPIRGFSVTVAINMVADPEQRVDPYAESNEISVWAGDTFYGDVEWGIVARVETGKIYAFLQIGNGSKVINFSQKIIRDADGRFYTYNCTLERVGDNEVLRVVSGGVDLTLIRYNPFPELEQYRVIMKSHRINDIHLEYFANMTVTRFDLYG